MNTPKIHLLIPLKQPVRGITHKAKCQRAFKFSTGRQLRGTMNPNEVTCTKCKGR